MTKPFLWKITISRSFHSPTECAHWNYVKQSNWEGYIVTIEETIDSVRREIAASLPSNERFDDLIECAYLGQLANKE
jgi:hypothetical protein